MKYFLLTVLGLIMAQCASENNALPDNPNDFEDRNPNLTSGIPGDKNPNRYPLANPIAIQVDEANEQVILVNSNVDVFFENGSILTIDVDATDSDDVILTGTSVEIVPSYAGNVAFNGDFLYVPYRDGDDIIEYRIQEGIINRGDIGNTGPNPFGVAINGDELIVVSDYVLNVFNRDDLEFARNIDFDLEGNPLDFAGSAFVENIAIDTANDRAYISNRGDYILVVDLNTNQFTHTIVGPRNTRGIAIDENEGFVYAVDGFPPALWVFDANSPELDNLNDIPREIDDADIFIDLSDLDFDPNGIVLDLEEKRAYVANTFDNTITVLGLEEDDESNFGVIQVISLFADETPFNFDANQPFDLDVGTFNNVRLLFVANFGSNDLYVINTETLEIVGRYF